MYTYMATAADKTYLFNKMMRQAALQCLRSTKKTSKSKPFWLANIKTTTASKLSSKPNRNSLCNRDGFIPKSPTIFWPLTRQLHAHPFCTNAVSSMEDFTVTRSKPELVGPTKPTPHELKSLSNIDHWECYRCVVPVIMFYRYNPSMHGKDPAKVIRDALASALVVYYPLAGRLIEGSDKKLSVDCTSEGVWFMEADADVELAQLGDPLRPPFPWLEKLIYNDAVSGGIINSPLYYIQVTRLKCGSFTLAFHYNHTLCDAMGLAQFLTAMGEIALGASAPSITPIWSRELFSSARTSVCTSYDQDEKVGNRDATIISFNNTDMIQRSFFFGASELSAICRLVPDHLRFHSTMFETLTAFLWRCRTAALQFDPDDVVRLMFSHNARDRTNQVVPVGYYGNAVAAGVTETSARQLCESPIEYALGLIKKAKEEGTKECMSWRTNPPVIRDLPSLDKCFMVSDARRAGLGDVDFGWGKPTYAGMAEFRGPAAFYIPFGDRNGEDGILVCLGLEAKAMERFESEVNNFLSHG